jgi:hypothetical protein
VVSDIIKEVLYQRYLEDGTRIRELETERSKLMRTIQSINNIIAACQAERDAIRPLLGWPIVIPEGTSHEDH